MPSDASPDGVGSAPPATRLGVRRGRHPCLVSLFRPQDHVDAPARNGNPMPVRWSPRSCSGFQDGTNRWIVLLGLNPSPFGAIALLWFVAVVRRRQGAREDQFFSTLFVRSGHILAVLVVASAAAASVPTLVVQYGYRPSPDMDIIAVSRGLWFGLFLISSSRFAACS